MSPADHLCAAASRRGRTRSPTSATSIARRAGIDPDVDDVHAPGVRTARFEQQPRLQRNEAHGRVGVDRVAADFTGQAVDARRDVDRERRHRGRTRGDRDRRRRAVERAAESGAEHRIDEEVGAREGTYEHDRGSNVSSIANSSTPTPRCRSTRAATRPSAPLLPLPHDHHDAPPVRPSQLPPGRGRDRTPGALDEHRLRRPARDGPPVGFGHLGRREHREHTTIVGDRSGACLVAERSARRRRDV